MIEKVLIIGNGFNNALKLGVDYCDYFNSPYWRNLESHNKDKKIIQFLSAHVAERNYNIEDILEKYLDEACSTNATKDKKVFIALEKSFSKFVDNQILQKKKCDFNQSDKAFCKMSSYCEMRNNCYQNTAIFIYSFSYVRYDDIRRKFDQSIYEDIEQGEKDNYKGNPWGGNNFDIAYNHGMSSKGKSRAIFGLSLDAFCGKRKSLINRYKFLLKEQHTNYPIENKCYLINSLFEASTIEFFGFGFTKPDLPYIRDWLTTIPIFDKKREITFNVLKEDKDYVLNNIKEVARDNWSDFISHYNIKMSYEDNSEDYLDEGKLD